MWIKTWKILSNERLEQGSAEIRLYAVYREFAVKSVLKALPYLCICSVKECSELNWKLVMEFGFLLLHMEFLLHLGLLCSFFWNLDIVWLWQCNTRCEMFREAGRKVYKDRGTMGSSGWYKLIVEIPLSVITEDNPNSSIFCRIYWRGTEGWWVEGK